MNMAESFTRDAINHLASQVHILAKQSGWHDEPLTDPHMICNIHGELSEALFAIRGGNKPDKHLPQHSAAEVEIADTILRIFDFCGSKGWKDIGQVVIDKHNFNKTRGYKHGGKPF